NGGKNSLNRLIRCVCGKKIGPDPRNFNQRVSLGRNDLLIRTFPKKSPPNKKSHAVSRLVYRVILQPIIIKKKEIMNV
ncbi:hypothetical protein U0609_17330, partial [Enterobacter hormaechei]